MNQRVKQLILHLFFDYLPLDRTYTRDCGHMEVEA